MLRNDIDVMMDPVSAKAKDRTHVADQYWPVVTTGLYHLCQRNVGEWERADKEGDMHGSFRIAGTKWERIWRLCVRTPIREFSEFDLFWNEVCPARLGCPLCRHLPRWRNGAATLLVSVKLHGSYRYFYAPRGFLLDYADHELPQAMCQGVK